MIKVFCIHNDGPGHSGPLEVPEGTTVGQLFAQEIHSGGSPEYHLFRINGKMADLSEPLRDGDHLLITPRTITATSNPWLDWFGRSADDPDFDDYLEEIARARRTDTFE